MTQLTMGMPAGDIQVLVEDLADSEIVPILVDILRLHGDSTDVSKQALTDG